MPGEIVPGKIPGEWYFPGQGITVWFGCDGGDCFSIYAHHDLSKSYVFHICTIDSLAMMIFGNETSVPDVSGYKLTDMITADLKAGRASIDTLAKYWRFRTWTEEGEITTSFIMHAELL